MPPLATEGLRGCQVEAIGRLEHSLSENHPRALIQMATGSGKTYTASDLDRSVLAKDQIRTVVRTYRDKLKSDLYPGRTVFEDRLPRRGHRGDRAREVLQ